MFCHSKVIARVSPIKVPPANEERVPMVDIPPFVPGGTGFRVVMRMGGERDKMPSSEASVSPRQQAKCLRNRRLSTGEEDGALPLTLMSRTAAPDSTKRKAAG